MHFENIADWQHEHSFGQDQRRPGESRTIWVIVLTATMMVVEIGAGILYGSMALLADGLHMASHAAALTISAFAYIYARRHAHDSRFSFGTGKVNSLGGFSGALLLAVFALMMAWESCERLLNPVSIAYNQAILVAILGLVVNGASVFILGVHDHGHDDDSGHAHSHAHAHSHSHSPGTHDHDGGHHHDHNLRAAYLHVMADALTSVLAIFALLLAKYKGLNWMDPVMGIVGAVLISKWSLGLLRTTSRVLLDRQVAPKTLEAVRSCVEEDSDNKVADLHVWSIGPGIFAAEISLVTHHPQAPDHYRHLLRSQPEIVHANFEVHQCHDAEHGCKVQHDHAH